MKQNSNFLQLFIICGSFPKAVMISVFLVSLIAGLGLKARAQENNSSIHNINITFDEVIASARGNGANGLETFDSVSGNFVAERKHSTIELIRIFNDPKSSNFNKCASAYYLGEIRSPESIEFLASAITLQLDTSHFYIQHLVETDKLKYPAMNALIKIGTPSISVVIRNLIESDDAQVRDLSLQVLSRIEGDKDIVQLRLQKALAAEKDAKNQERLQSALKALADTPFAN